MGTYTGLRFKGIVKKQFREEFAPVALRGCWEDAKDKKISNFANCSRASFIPCGALCYMVLNGLITRKAAFGLFNVV